MPHSSRTHTAPTGGEASAVFKLDKRGYIEGQLLGFTNDNQLRTISWAQVDAKTSSYNITQYSWDGYYEMYLDPGIYNITLAIEGYNALQTNVSISPGQVSTGFSFQLELNNTQLLDYKRPLIITVATPDYEKRLNEH